MSRLVFGHDKPIAEWVAARIPHFGTAENFGNCKAIGVAQEDRFLAGVVYHDWQPKYGTIQLSMAAVTPRWATRRNIILLLYYPFEDAKANLVWTATPHQNKRAIDFNTGIGFTKEAVLAHRFGQGRHAVICRMERAQYQAMIKRFTRDGQVQQSSRAA
jgi:hypothetical protein